MYCIPVVLEFRIRMRIRKTMLIKWIIAIDDCRDATGARVALFRSTTALVTGTAGREGDGIGLESGGGGCGRRWVGWPVRRSRLVRRQRWHRRR